MSAKAVRKGSLVALWVLAIIAWSIVPYKAWSRLFLGFEGFNLGDVVFVLLGWPFIIQIFRDRRANPIYPWIVFLWIVVGLSVMKGLFTGENVREMARIVRGVLFWCLIPMMVTTIQSIVQMRRWFTGMSLILIVASGTIVLFSFFPSMIPMDDEVGAFREEMFGAFERVFTLSMWGMYGGAAIALGAIMFSRPHKLAGSLMLGVLLLGLSFTFARTFYLGLLVALGIYLLFVNKELVRTLVFGAVAVSVAVLMLGIPDAVTVLAESVSERTLGLLRDDPALAFQTFFWRLSEFDSLTANMPSVADKVFGVLGRSYVLPDGYEASMPHISYFGMYYAHGYLGLVAYVGLLVVTTLRMKQTIALSVGTRYHWMTVSAFVAWVCLVIAAISAPAFQFVWGVATIAFAVGISETARQLGLREKVMAHVAS